LTAYLPAAILLAVPSKRPAPPKALRQRSPRIRVPNGERALFAVDAAHFVGVVQRLSLSGGSAVLSKGPIARGTWGTMALQTVHGKVSAQVEFLQMGADGVPLAQAFRFLNMDEASSQRFAAAAAEMQEAGFSDVPHVAEAQPLAKLVQSVRRIAATIYAHRQATVRH
jgi:hypothetical protein